MSPLKGFFEGEMDMGLGMDVDLDMDIDINIDTDVAVSIHLWGSFKGLLSGSYWVALRGLEATWRFL